MGAWEIDILQIGIRRHGMARYYFVGKAGQHEWRSGWVRLS
jgi:hypothetical protein